MEDIADIILKHDGYIWGAYAWYKAGGIEKPDVIKCRFVTKSIFSIMETIIVPQQFLIDLAEKFTIVNIKKDTIKVYKDREYTIHVKIHTPSEELNFIENSDFTCNLIDYRRDGMFLRCIPRCIAYDICPYDSVIKHIRNKTLVICHHSAIAKCKSFFKLGWKMPNDTIVPGVYVTQADKISEKHYKEIDPMCGICHCNLSDLCVRTRCIHAFHHNCLSRWLETADSCPMCRETI